MPFPSQSKCLNFNSNAAVNKCCISTVISYVLVSGLLYTNVEKALYKFDKNYVSIQKSESLCSIMPKP